MDVPKDVASRLDTPNSLQKLLEPRAGFSPGFLAEDSIRRTVRIEDVCCSDPATDASCCFISFDKFRAGRSLAGVARPAFPSPLKTYTTYTTFTGSCQDQTQRNAVSLLLGPAPVPPTVTLSSLLRTRSTLRP